MFKLLGKNRKILLINPQFQLSFLGYTAAMAAGVILVFYGASALFFWRFAEKGRALGLPTDHVFFKFLAEQRLEMNLIFIGTAIAAALFLFLFGLFLSHRVAGPLYHLRKHLGEITAGKTLEDVHFRKNDYFPEVATSVNSFLKYHREKTKT